MFIAWLLLAFTLPHARAAYDEAYDAWGEIRPPYRDFINFHKTDVLNPTYDVRTFMIDAPLDDSQKAWPVPLVLSPHEYQTIQKGVLQRAKVYKALFEDVVLGEQRLFETLTPVERATIQQVFEAGGGSLSFWREMYRGRSVKFVRFLYGPDLIRGPDGQWLVIEDNLGEGPGGLADGDRLRASFSERSSLNLPTLDFIGDAIKIFLDDLGLAPAAAKAFMAPSKLTLTYSDLERQRIVEAISRSGVETLSLAVNGGVEVLSELGLARGLLLFDEPSRYSQLALLELVTDAAQGKHEHFITPGTSAMSDKALLPFMERFARFYLGEELLLHSPPTWTISDFSELAEVFDEHGENLVLKERNGRAGQLTYFWRKMNDLQQDVFLDRVEDVHAANLLRTGFETPSMVIQPFVESSRLTFGGPDNLSQARIDIRPLVYVGPEQSVVSALPWGRAINPFGGDLHNVSRGAQHLVVLTSCAENLR